MHSIASGTIGIEVPTAASKPAASAELIAGRQINLVFRCQMRMLCDLGAAPGASRSFSIGSAGRLQILWTFLAEEAR